MRWPITTVNEHLIEHMLYPVNFPYSQLRDIFFLTIIFPVNVFMTETASEILGKTRDSRRGRKVPSSEPGN